MKFYKLAYKYLSKIMLFEEIELIIRWIQIVLLIRLIVIDSTSSFKSIFWMSGVCKWICVRKFFSLVLSDVNSNSFLLKSILIFNSSNCCLRLFKLKPFSLFLSLVYLINSSSRILSSERNVNSLVKAFKTALSNFPLLKLLNLQEVYRE